MKKDSDRIVKLAFLPDGKVLSLPSEQDAQLLLQDILSVDLHRHTAISLGMELECEDCCKYVYNGTFAVIYIDLDNPDNSYVHLMSAPGNFLIMEAHSGGRLAEKELLKTIKIPFYRFCSLSIVASRILFTTLVKNSGGSKELDVEAEIPQDASLLECSVCCMNIANTDTVIPGFLTELKPELDDLLLLRMFSGKRLIKEQYLFKYFIPSNRLCEVQGGGYKISPCIPWYSKNNTES